MNPLAAFVLEKEFASLTHLLPTLMRWVMLFGIVCACVIPTVELLRLARRRGSSWNNGLGGQLRNLPAGKRWRLWGFRLCLLAMLGAWFGVGFFAGLTGTTASQGNANSAFFFYRAATFVLTLAAAAFSVLTLLWEFLLDLLLLSPRRVWALALLGIREALRRKALWGFVAVLVLFLFASWFIQADRPQEQWRTYVNLVFFVLTGLLLITGSVLASYGIPNDIRHQTIHTVVTKPVQRLEIILGRILGLGLLLTAVIFIIAHVSLLYVFRQIDPLARDATMRARVYELGQLKFEEVNAQGQFVQKERGTDVGREWEYRSHIRGGSTEEAVWRFAPFSGEMGSKSWQEANRFLLAEFGFDIYRMSTNRDSPTPGVFVMIKAINPRKWNGSKYNEFRQELDAGAATTAEAERERSRKYGYWELREPIIVEDYKTYQQAIPTSVLEGLDNAPLEIRVACRSPGQYLGMARHDLYLVPAEGSFYTNFMKGVLGIWLITLMVVSIGVVLSTFCNALVSMMGSWTLLFLGVPRVRGFVEFISKAPDPTVNPGGGPLESAYRLFRGMTITTPLDDAQTFIKVIRSGDFVFRLLFQALSNLVPDLYQYDRTTHIGEGFDIPVLESGMSVVLLVGYLIPFLVAGYYFLNSREVAG